MSIPYVLINPFVVAKGKEDEFIAAWTKAAALIKDEPGFIDSKLHRSIDPNTRFQFVNVAHWTSQQAWKAALSKPQFRELSQQVEAEANPALYVVAVEY